MFSSIKTYIGIAVVLSIVGMGALSNYLYKDNKAKAATITELKRVVEEHAEAFENYKKSCAISQNIVQQTNEITRDVETVACNIKQELHNLPSKGNSQGKTGPESSKNIEGRLGYYRGLENGLQPLETTNKPHLTYNGESYEEASLDDVLPDALVSLLDKAYCNASRGNSACPSK